MTISIRSAQLTALFLQGVFYGPYIITCYFAGRTLLRERSSRSWRTVKDINFVVLGCGAFLLVNGTLNMVFVVYRVLMAFVDNRDDVGGPEGYFMKVGLWVNVGVNATHVLQTLASDMLLIYRLHIVYGRFWMVIIAPAALMLACVYAIIRQSIIGIRLGSFALIYSKELFPYVVAAWTTTIAQNLLSTALIVVRVWRIEKQLTIHTGNPTRLSDGKQSSLMRVIYTVVESGLLITTFAFLTFVSIVAKSNGFYVTALSGVIVVGIAFNLIIIRSVTQQPTLYGNSTRPGISTIPMDSVQGRDNVGELDDDDFSMIERTARRSFDRISKADGNL